ACGDGNQRRSVHRLLSRPYFQQHIIYAAFSVAVRREGDQFKDGCRLLHVRVDDGNARRFKPLTNSLRLRLHARKREGDDGAKLMDGGEVVRRKVVEQTAYAVHQALCRIIRKAECRLIAQRRVAEIDGCFGSFAFRNVLFINEKSRSFPTLRMTTRTILFRKAVRCGQFKPKCGSRDQRARHEIAAVPLRHNAKLLHTSAMRAGSETHCTASGFSWYWR